MIRQWNEISKFSAVFNDVVVMFSAEKYPRLSNLLLSIFMLKLQIAYHMDPSRFSSFSEPVQKFLFELRSEVNSACEEYYDNLLICAATATDVRMRNFDPKGLPQTTDEEKLTFKQFSVLHSAYGTKILARACEYYYKLFPKEWEEETRTNTSLKKAMDPQYQQQRGLHVDPTMFYVHTEIAAELKVFFQISRNDLRDPEAKDNKVGYSTDAASWLAALQMLPRVRRLGLATQFVPASQIDCERIWKKVGEVMTKHRGALQVATAADQVYLKLFWALLERFPELKPLHEQPPSKRAALAE